MFVIKTPSC